MVDGPLPAEDDALRRRARARRAALRAPPRAARRCGASARPGRRPPRRPPPSPGGEVGLLWASRAPRPSAGPLEALGARVVAERSFPDHHRYRAADLAGLAALAPLWLTTEKDAVKLAPAWLGGTDLRVLSIELEGTAAVVELAARRLPPR